MLSAWLANKTPGNVRTWIVAPSYFCVVAVEGPEVRGFGMVQRDGEIQLCYLVPEVQYLGVEKLLLHALEEQAVCWGLDRVFLTSSITAKKLYQRNGYLHIGEPKSVYGLRTVFPMSKSIGLPGAF